MPEVLTKKMFGLPRWAWLIILATAIGVGLYLRHKHKQEEETEEVSPEEAPIGVTPTEAVPVGAYNEGEPGGPYYYGPGGGGYYGYPESIYPEEQEHTPNTEINIGVPLPSANDGGSEVPPGTEHAGVTGKKCHEKPTNIPNGYHVECVSGRWKLVPNKKAGSHPSVGTGGGPPNRPDNKKPGHTPTGGPKIGVGDAHPVSTPTAVAHPNAVDTGNACVKGGVGGHTAPPGYHLFCGTNGHIWRAPNS